MIVKYGSMMSNSESMITKHAIMIVKYVTMMSNSRSMIIKHESMFFQHEGMILKWNSIQIIERWKWV